MTSDAASGWYEQDVVSLVKRWYTRNPNDWKPNLGFMTRVSAEPAPENRFRNGIYSDSDMRPRLTITFQEPIANLAFGSALGPDFAPSTMAKGTTVTIPMTVENASAPGYDWGTTVDSNYYALGYRWFDSKGKPVSQSGFTNYGTAAMGGSTLNAGAAPKAVNITVTSPPAAGQYTLRFDVAHYIDGDWYWFSDWAQPAKYFAMQKYSSSPSNVRWAGNSRIQRAEFPVAVVTGQGNAVGDLQTVDLADGSSVGINLWSKNLRHEGDTGLGFADLGRSIDLTYTYDLAESANCTGVLAACGWATNYDESFDGGTNGADYTYQDADGNRYLVGVNGQGQLGSSAPVRLDRVRHTVIDEAAQTWSTGTAPTRYSTGTAVTLLGTYGVSIPASNTGTTSTNFKRVPLTTHPLLSFGIRGATATRGGIGFQDPQRLEGRN